MTVSPNPAISFLVKMRKLDKATVTPRDVVVLWAVKTNPGMMGRELALKIGLDSRSNVQYGVARLVRLGMLEDRRTAQNRLTPNDLYITPAGEQFLEEILS